MTAMAELPTADTTEKRAGRTVTFGTFAIERTFRMAPKAVFDAWASRADKYAWFVDVEGFLKPTAEYALDFRVGGRERLDGILEESGQRFEYDLTYGDIVDGERIVATYDVLIDGRRISVSVMTVEFNAVDAGTHLELTEQGVFLDGFDTNEERIAGATAMFDNLEAHLQTK